MISFLSEILLSVFHISNKNSKFLLSIPKRNYTITVEETRTQRVYSCYISVLTQITQLVNDKARLQTCTWSLQPRSSPSLSCCPAQWKGVAEAGGESTGLSLTRWEVGSLGSCHWKTARIVGNQRIRVKLQSGEVSIFEEFYESVFDFEEQGREERLDLFLYSFRH